MIFFLFGCKEDKIPLSELKNISLIGNPDTYSFTIEIKGKTNCPVQLKILRNNRETSLIYHLKGVIDTVITDDWYEEKMSFKVEPQYCINKESFVKIKLHN